MQPNKRKQDQNQTFSHMKKILRKWSRACSLFGALALSLAAASGLHAEPAQPKIVLEASYAGPFKALAQLAFAAFTKGDLPSAELNARILEKCWDRCEVHLKKTDMAKWQTIDGAMDAFISPLISHDSTSPDDVKKGYEAYLASLQSLTE